MGSSQSKRKLNSTNNNVIGKGRHQYEQESILAAIAVNKRQRKLLLKQAKLAKYHQHQHQHQHEREQHVDLPQGSPKPVHRLWKSGSYTDYRDQMCYASCQSLYRGGRELSVDTGDYLSPDEVDSSFLNHPIYLPPAKSEHSLATTRQVASSSSSSSANNRLRQQVNGKQQQQQQQHQAPLSRQRKRRLKCNNININNKLVSSAGFNVLSPLDSNIDYDHEQATTSSLLERRRNHHQRRRRHEQHHQSTRLGSLTTSATATPATELYLSEDEAYFEELEMASEESETFLAATAAAAADREGEYCVPGNVAGEAPRRAATKKKGLQRKVGAAAAAAAAGGGKGIAESSLASGVVVSSSEHASRPWPPSAVGGGRRFKQRRRITEAAQQARLQLSDVDVDDADDDDYDEGGFQYGQPVVADDHDSHYAATDDKAAKGKFIAQRRRFLDDPTTTTTTTTIASGSSSSRSRSQLAASLAAASEDLEAAGGGAASSKMALKQPLVVGGRVAALAAAAAAETVAPKSAQLKQSQIILHQQQPASRYTATRYNSSTIKINSNSSASNNNNNNNNNNLQLASGSRASAYSSSASSTSSGSRFNHLNQQYQPQQHQRQDPPRQMFVQPRYQRGLAYSEDERKRMGLLGLLPAAQQDLELQVRVVMNFIENCCPSELSKYVYLRQLKDFNERLFYASLIRHVEKLMPIVYTPTVGLACQKFSEIYMRPRGLFIRAQDSGKVANLLFNWPDKDVRVIVVTDGERILGLGDLGANGMGISIGKLSLYTALAGIPPENVLPITLDVGTNNESLLKNPFYIGLRERRLRGPTYDALLEEFMEAVANRWGRSCLIQFEDFANSTAFALLERYRNRYCTFNDDIQGTASVCLSGLITAAKLIGRRLADCTFLFYGAGEANLGTANLIIMAMMEEGASKAEANKQIWLIDSKGLVVSSRNDLSEHKRLYAKEGPQVNKLEEIIDYIKPSAIIGASAQGKAFSESICRKMATFNERPIIFALSNPTSKAECTAEEAYKWTDGRCVFASGSPFEPVVYGGKTYVTGQGNNAYIFPGVGLAAIAAHLHSIPEDTFLVAARALSDQVSETDLELGLVYPRLSKIRDVTLKVATRVLEHLYTERLATYRPEPDDKMTFLKSIQYNCQYNDEDSTSNTISLGQMSLANSNSNSNKTNGASH